MPPQIRSNLAALDLYPHYEKSINLTTGINSMQMLHIDDAVAVEQEGTPAHGGRH